MRLLVQENAAYTTAQCSGLRSCRVELFCLWTQIIPSSRLLPQKLTNLFLELVAKLQTELDVAAKNRKNEDDSTLKMLKLECQEHAKTIVKLEEKIIALSHENQQNIEAKTTALAEKQGNLQMSLPISEYV